MAGRWKNNQWVGQDRLVGFEPGNLLDDGVRNQANGLTWRCSNVL